MKNAVRVVVCLALLVLSTASLALAQPAARDPLLLVVNRAPMVLSIFKADGPTLTLLKKLPIPKESREISVSPDGRRAYVSSQGESSVTVVDLDKLAVIATITDPNLVNADGGVVSADSKTFYVTSTGKDLVVVIDTATNKVVKTIPTGSGAPRRLIISPDGKTMYVGHNKTDLIGVIDLAAGRAVKHIKVGNECRGGFGFSPDGKVLLNNSVEDDTMYFIDLTTDKVRKIIGVPFSPQRIEMTPKGTAIVLSGGQGRAVTIMEHLEHHDATSTVRVGDAAWGLALNADATFAYASNYRDGTLSIVDLVNKKLAATFPVGDDPNGVAFRK
jgi:YVTN family beta-propeller protein